MGRLPMWETIVYTYRISLVKKKISAGMMDEARVRRSRAAVRVAPMRGTLFLRLLIRSEF